MLLPNNFSNDFFSRTLLFAKYSINRNIDSEEYLNNLKSVKIAVSGTREVLTSFNGQYMILMAINLLSRFCLNIDIIIPSDIKSSVNFPHMREDSLSLNLERLCKNINPAITVSTMATTKQRYDCVLAIGNCSKDLGRTVFINSDGWISYINTENNYMPWISNNQNPIGAFAASCLGVAELFKSIFSKIKNLSAIGSLVFSAYDYGFRSTPYINPILPDNILLDDIHFISMGAINSAVLYSLCAIPNLKGNATVIEPQTLDISNLNRYIFALAKDAINSIAKVDSAKNFAETSFNLNTLSKSFEDVADEFNNINLAIVGVDNIESRWAVQKNTPAKIICGGTSEMGDIRISKHITTIEGACVGCIYPIPLPLTDDPIPTISFVSVLAGVLSAGEIIKLYMHNHVNQLNNILELNLLSMSYFRHLFMPKSENCPLKDIH